MDRRKHRFGIALGHWLAVTTATLALAGCGGGGSGGEASSSTTSGTGTNHAPQIAGSPATTVQAGTAYTFRPSASDADSNPLRFQISGQPAWASFDPISGALTGTPTDSNVGTSDRIVISVSDGAASAALAEFWIQVQSPPAPPSGNLEPVILGTPMTSVSAGQPYSFQPSASDPNGDSLTFTIVNKPAWATFNPGTGQLTGTPGGSEVGSYTDIVISVSDGLAGTSLMVFAITVTQISNGTATISWVPPTEKTDGTPLMDLGGYRIHYGTNAAALTEIVEISNPGLTRYVVQNLSPAKWYFALRAYRTDGTESTLSNIASKTIL